MRAVSGTEAQQRVFNMVTGAHSGFSIPGVMLMRDMSAFHYSLRD